MVDVKEKINLLDVIPFRSENITAEKGSDGTVTIAFPGLNTSGCGDSCCLKECLRIFMSGWKIMALPYGS